MVKFDLEDPSELYAPDGRYAPMTERILALCEAANRRATFFTIGKLAQAAPDLIRRIAAQGHEIAYHSHAHISLTEETPERFRRESREDKDRLEQLCGHPVVGFRAPRFSLTPQTLWATEVLAELGFAYSSSIMPTRLSRFGFPGAQSKPFRWPSGLIEMPLPMGRLGPLRLPYSGGIYLYAMPACVSDFFFSRAAPGEVLWTYAHPYDFDSEAPYAPMPHTPGWVSLLLWLARRQAGAKISRIIKACPGETLGEIAAKVKE